MAPTPRKRVATWRAKSGGSLYREICWLSARDIGGRPRARTDGSPCARLEATYIAIADPRPGGEPAPLETPAPRPAIGRKISVNEP